MKTLVLILLFFLPGYSVSTLKISIKNIRPGEGDIVIELYNSEASFFKTPVLSRTLPADRTSLDLDLSVANGIYAVAAYQDINKNKKLDKGWFNVPKEPYGLSNNFRPHFSAPTFDDCKFFLKRDTAVQIILK